MAIDTVNKKLAAMEMEDYWEPALPISPGALGQDDQQQLLHGYPGILWAGGGTFDEAYEIGTFTLAQQRGLQFNVAQELPLDFAVAQQRALGFTVD